MTSTPPIVLVDGLWLTPLSWETWVKIGSGHE
jgi:hypothetical protein